MKWTTDKPSVPGWYWWRGLSGKAWITEVLLEKDGNLCVDWGMQVAHCCYEWAGPIPEPEEL